MRGGDSLDSLRSRVERRLPEMYLVLGLAVTGLLCFLTAPFFGPDEPNQACRAISLSHGVVVAHLGPSGLDNASSGTEEAGAEIDAGALEAMNGVNEIRMAWERRSTNFHDRPHGPVDEQSQLPLAGIGWARTPSIARAFGGCWNSICCADDGYSGLSRSATSCG